MKYYTDGMARPFTSIIINDEPLEMDEGLPQLFVPIYATREACIEHTGMAEPLECDLAIIGEVQ